MDVMGHFTELGHHGPRATLRNLEQKIFDRINPAAGKLEAWLLQQKEVVSTQAVVGSVGTAGLANTASIPVQLVPMDKRSGVFVLAPRYRKALTGQMKDFPNPRVSVSAGGGFRGQGAGVSYTITAPDFNALFAVNNKALAYLQGNRIVADVNSDLSIRPVSYVNVTHAVAS